MQKYDGHGREEVGRRCQRSLTLETRFTPRSGARAEETEACPRDVRMEENDIEIVKMGTVTPLRVCTAVTKSDAISS